MNRQKIRQAVGPQKGRERHRVVGLYRGSETDIHTHLSVGAGEQGQRHHRPAARDEQDKDHRTARLRHQRRCGQRPQAPLPCIAHQGVCGRYLPLWPEAKG